MMSREKQMVALAELRAYLCTHRTAAEIAAHFQISKPTAYARLRLLNLQTSVQRAQHAFRKGTKGPRPWAYYVSPSAP